MKNTSNHSEIMVISLISVFRLFLELFANMELKIPPCMEILFLENFDSNILRFIRTFNLRSCWGHFHSDWKLNNVMQNSTTKVMVRNLHTQSWKNLKDWTREHAIGSCINPTLQVDTHLRKKKSNFKMLGGKESSMQIHDIGCGLIIWYYNL